MAQNRSVRIVAPSGREVSLRPSPGHAGLLCAIRRRHRLAHEDTPDMAKRTSAWVPLTAAVVASLAYGGADGTEAYAAGDDQMAYELRRPLADQGDASARLDPGLVYAKRHGAAG